MVSRKTGDEVECVCVGWGGGCGGGVGGGLNQFNVQNLTLNSDAVPDYDQLYVWSAKGPLPHL